MNKLFYANEHTIRYADYAKDQTCHNCHQAGFSTEHPVWQLSGNFWDIVAEHWVMSGVANEICESCMFDDGPAQFIAAPSMEDAITLWGMADDIQADNIVVDGRTVGALSWDVVPASMKE